MQYSDIPQANALYTEQQNIQAAIGLIDGGGTLSAMTIVPAPTLPGAPFVMAVSVTNLGTIAPETMAAVRAQLVERGTEIAGDISALGVTDEPPAKI